jgi:hypothetical protein
MMSLRGEVFICPYAPNIETAMGRSNPVPLFRIDAGEIFTVILEAGNFTLEFFIAVRTRSLDSLISVESRPTMEKLGKPFDTSDSQVTGMLSIPFKVAVLTEQYIVNLLLNVK